MANGFYSFKSKILSGPDLIGIMELIPLDGARVKVSRLGFGCEPLGGMDWGKVDIKEIEYSICDAIDLGWNYFDTAAVYGLGLSEHRLGKILSKQKNNIIIATKVGLEWNAVDSFSGRANIKKNGHPEFLVKSVESSLKRLDIESIPLVFLHYPDPDVPVEDSLGALAELRRQGKIQFIGVSNFDYEQLKRASSESKINAVQLECSLLDLSNQLTKNSALHWCVINDIPIVAYGVLARGLLTGKFGDKAPIFTEDDRRKRLPEFQADGYQKNYAIVTRLTRYAKKLDIPVGVLAIRLLLDAVGVDVAITGIKNRSQLNINNTAMNLQLREDTISEIMNDLYAKDIV